MKLLQNKTNLRDNNQCKLIIERPNHLDQLMKRKSFDWLKYNMQILLILKGIDKFIDTLGLNIGKMD